MCTRSTWRGECTADFDEAEENGPGNSEDGEREEGESEVEGESSCASHSLMEPDSPPKCELSERAGNRLVFARNKRVLKPFWLVERVADMKRSQMAFSTENSTGWDWSNGEQIFASE